MKIRSTDGTNATTGLVTVKCEQLLLNVKKMVGRVRFERTTNWLKANCSTD